MTTSSLNTTNIGSTSRTETSSPQDINVEATVQQDQLTPTTFAATRQNNSRQNVGRSVWQAIKGLPDTIKAWFQKTPPCANSGLPPNITVQLPQGLGTVTYRREELASMITSLPQSERQAARDALENTLATRLVTARNLVDNVLNGNAANHRCTPQDAADIMLFLDAKARACGNAFSQGAFMLQDEAGKLYEFLDTCPEKYLRSSSHLTEEQGSYITNGQEQHTNVHRGIDLPSGPNGVPHGKKTLLFATHFASGDNTKRRLFMKAEEHGVRLSYLGSRVREAGASAFPERPSHRADITAFFGHSLNFITSRGEASQSARKERIPTPVKKAYLKLVKASGIEKGNNPMSLDAVNTSQGLNIMISEAKRIMPRIDPSKHQNFILALQDFATAVAKKYIHLDNIEERIGNEMILSERDLGGSLTVLAMQER